ncbi:hypothetical protein BH23GEM9_BH23GEM9_28100 [soil metagenome]
MVSTNAVADEAVSPPPAAARWVVFTCAGKHFGFPLQVVSEIVTPRPFTRLPGAGRAVCGLVGLRGRVVTVFDTGTMLGLDPAAAQSDHRLLLIEVDSRRVGMAIDGVIAIAPARLEPRSGELGGRLAKAVLGTGRVHETTFVALDPEALVTPLLR